MEGQIFIEGEITPQTTLDVKDVLLRNQNAESFCIHISSPGGSVYDGYKIFHAIRNAATQNGKSKPVRAVIEGEAQSMATFIAMAADKGSIEIADPSRYMIHNPSMGVKGTAEDFKQGASELAQIEDEMAATYALRTGLSIDQCKEMMKNTTTMTAREAVSKGFADKLSTHLRAVALGKNMENEEIKTIGQKIDSLIDSVSKIAKPKAVTGPPKQAAPPTPPVPKPAKAMVDAPLQDGTTLSIDAPNEDSLIGAAATLNGSPAPDGDYPCQDGDIITVAGGMVTAVTTAMDALAKQNSELQAKLDALTPTVAKVEEQAQVIEEVKTTAKALKEELTTLKNKTVGNPDKPNEGLATRHLAGQGPSAMAAQETANFLGKEMPWLAQFNTKRGNSPVLSTPIETGPQAISILETSFNYTYPGILTTDIYYKSTLDTPALSDMFTIDQGISFRKKYNLVTQLSNLLQPYGGCTRLFNGNRQLITNATVETKEFQLAESWCKDDFTAQLTGVYNFLAQEWLKTGIASFDPTGTPIAQVIDKVLSDALRRDVFQRATMGAGNSSSSNYNQIDGLWDRLIDSSGASNYCVVRGGSALGVGTLSAGAALTALQAVFAASNPLLKQMIGKATFWVTGSVYDNYVQSLVGTGNVSANQFQNTIDGVNGSINLTVGGGINYLGIPIKPVRFWDQSLADTNNPLNATTRHLILLTVKENHILGVENGGDLNKIEGWYERKDRKFYYESDMKFGYNYLHCDLSSIAY
jgi:ATP-dependent Clp endopeptidase proteolytic subunit ClpP